MTPAALLEPFEPSAQHRALLRLCEPCDELQQLRDKLQRFSEQLEAWTRTPEYRAGRREALKASALSHKAQQAAERAAAANTATLEAGARALQLLEQHTEPERTALLGDTAHPQLAPLVTGRSAHAPPRRATHSRGAAA